MTLEIRAATFDDTEELREYSRRLFAEHLPGIFRRDVPSLEQEREYIRTRIEPENATMLVAIVDGLIVGMLDFVGGTLAEEAHAGTFGISVDQSCRGHGVGSALLRALIEWAPAHGIRRIQAWVWANNPRAGELYERLGFEREGLCREAIMYDGEPVDAVIMARLIG